jgi:hypothetical protein
MCSKLQTNSVLFSYSVELLKWSSWISRLFSSVHNSIIYISKQDALGCIIPLFCSVQLNATAGLRKQPRMHKFLCVCFLVMSSTKSNLLYSTIFWLQLVLLMPRTEHTRQSSFSASVHPFRSLNIFAETNCMHTAHNHKYGLREFINC